MNDTTTTRPPMAGSRITTIEATAAADPLGFLATLLGPTPSSGTATANDPFATILSSLFGGLGTTGNTAAPTGDPFSSLLGSLSGGTSPAGPASAANPLALIANLFGGSSATGPATATDPMGIIAGLFGGIGGTSPATTDPSLAMFNRLMGVHGGGATSPFGAITNLLGSLLGQGTGGTTSSPISQLLGLVGSLDGGTGPIDPQAAASKLSGLLQTLLAPGQGHAPVAGQQDPTPYARWANKDITYSLSPEIGQAEHAVIDKAFAYWSQYDGMRFHDVTGAQTGNIQIGWGNLAEDRLGQTEWVQHAGPRPTLVSSAITLEDPSIHPFDAGTTTYSGTSTTLLEDAAHEIGHALGLGASTDPTAAMYDGTTSILTMLTIQGTTTGLPIQGNASDRKAMDDLYGGNATTGASADASLPDVVRFSGNQSAVYRFFDTKTGTQFLTSSVDERNDVIRHNPGLTYEGLGMASVANPSNDAAAAPVYRFFNTDTGTHFFTTSASEAQTVAAARPDMRQEAATIYEHVTRQAGDAAVYRFFNSGDGSHFYTTSAGEAASISAARPDMVAEGVAFYTPHG